MNSFFFKHTHTKCIQNNSSKNMKQYEVWVEIQNMTCTKYCRLTRNPLSVTYNMDTKMISCWWYDCALWIVCIYLSKHPPNNSYLFISNSTPNVHHTLFCRLCTVSPNHLHTTLLTSGHTQHPASWVSHHFPFNDPGLLVMMMMIMSP